MTQNLRFLYQIVRTDTPDEDIARRGLLTNSLSLAMVVASLVLLPAAFAANTITFLLTDVVSLGIAVSAYVLSKRGSVRLAAILLVTILSLIVGQSILFAPSFNSAYGNYALPLSLFVVIAAVLIHPLASFYYAFLTNCLLVAALFTVPRQPKYQPMDNQPYSLMLITALIFWLLAFFSWQSARTTLNILTRLTREKLALTDANTALDVRRTASANVSQQVRTLAYTLTTVATQQVSGAQEQAAALSQVEQAVRELTRTAERIAENAVLVERAALATDSAAQRVLAVTQVATASSTQGQLAVAQTISASEEVNSVYSALTRTLIDLAERSLRIKAILELTQNIADETHLLALNAAIEAVGASQQGSRFGIVAQRVKELADRSRDASMQIGQIVRELQSRIQSAVMVAESGEKRARQSVGVAHESGAAITNLAATVQQAAMEAESIVSTAQNVSEVARLIGQATREQQTASTQILSTLTSVNIVAESTVTSSENLSQSVHVLDDLSSDLTQALATI